MAEISGLQRGAAVPQGAGRERPGNQKRDHNSEEVSSQEVYLAHTRYDDRKVNEYPVMKILLANCCSFFPKFNELSSLLPASQPSVICFTETWLTPSVSEPEVTLDGYTLFRSDRAVPRRGGGVALNLSSCLFILLSMRPVHVLKW